MLLHLSSCLLLQEEKVQRRRNGTHGSSVKRVRQIRSQHWMPDCSLASSVVSLNHGCSYKLPQLSICKGCCFILTMSLGSPCSTLFYRWKVTKMLDRPTSFGSVHIAALNSKSNWVLLYLPIHLRVRKMNNEGTSNLPSYLICVYWSIMREVHRPFIFGSN